MKGQIDIKMNQILFQALQVRYTKLFFTLVFLEDTILPKNKVSALRGGMGEMLLQMNCVRDRNCESCDFEPECIVQRTVYSKYEIDPVFLTAGESSGYVLECDNYQEKFEAGETLGFQMILFGKTIAYFNQFMQAFTMLGIVGLGREQAKFRICTVRNQRKKVIVDEESLNLENYSIQTVGDYVGYRMGQVSEKGLQNRVVFHTPATIKYQSQYMQEFQIVSLTEALKRRIYMLDCFEGIESDLREFQPALPEITEQKHEFTLVKRYSNRKNTHMELKGIRGYIVTSDMGEDFLELMLAGELIHVGKHTSFGFGKYTVR